MDASDLYWLPFRQVYQQLQAANRSSLDSLNELLKLNHSWLLDGTARFGIPNNTSAAALKGGGALRASTWGSKKGIVVDKHLVNATMELSQLLVGDSNGRNI